MQNKTENDSTESIPRMLTTAETSELLRVSIATLDRWNRKGVGPRRIALSPRDIRYRLSDIREWLDAK